MNFTNWWITTVMIVFADFILAPLRGRLPIPDYFLTSSDDEIDSDIYDQNYDHDYEEFIDDEEFASPRLPGFFEHWPIG
jgi:hypothetical protein